MRGIRQHVNPLGVYYQQRLAKPIEIRLQDKAKSGLKKSVEVELGCADAYFSFQLAREQPQVEVVGLEIRRAMVERNQTRLRKIGLPNLRFAYVNMSVDLDAVFPENSVDRFHLLFPDPWFKRRHQKRRVVDDFLCQVMARQLRAGGEFHMATDVFEVALDGMAQMESEFACRLGFVNLSGAWSFSRKSAWPYQSLREQTTSRRAQRVWRVRYLFRP